MTQNGHQAISLNIPILGEKKLGTARSGGPIAGLARQLDKSGTFEVDVIQGPNGQPMTVAHRDAFMDAEELLAAFREIVREEIRQALTEPVHPTSREDVFRALSGES